MQNEWVGTLLPMIRVGLATCTSLTQVKKYEELKMAKDMMSVVMLLVIVGVVIYGLNIGGIQDKLAGGTSSTVPSGGGIQTPVGNGNCPDDLATDFQADSMNPLNQSSTEYMVQTFRLVPAGDFAAFTAYATAATSTRTTAVGLKCSYAYTAYPLATQDAVNSVPSVEMGVVSGSATGKAFQVPRLALIKANAYDNIGKAFVYDSSDASNSDQESLAATFKSTTDNATATAVGVGGQVDWTFMVAPVTPVGQFGNKDMGLYVAVDASKTELDAPTLWYDNTPLTDVKGTGEISSDDEAVLSNYEYIYKIPADISKTNHNLRIALAAKAGQNPTSDVVLRFVGKGYYVGADGQSISSGIFNKATSAEILTATAQTITMDLS